MFSKIREKIDGNYYLYALKFKKFSPRVYFILVKENKKKLFEKNLNKFLNDFFKEFELYKEE